MNNTSNPIQNSQTECYNVTFPQHQQNIIKQVCQQNQECIDTVKRQKNLDYVCGAGIYQCNFDFAQKYVTSDNRFVWSSECQSDLDNKFKCGLAHEGDGTQQCENQNSDQYPDQYSF
jgi:hypothetical protein